MDILIGLILSYALGAVPFGLLVAHFWAKVDIREYGSGNIGMSNVLRSIGLVPAIIVLILDAGKGFIPVRLAMAYLPDADPIWWLLPGLLAIVGHNWSVFLGFRGGRGVATTLGLLIALMPMVAGIALSVWLIVLGISRYISLASIVAAFVLPFLILGFGEPIAYVILGLIVGSFTIYRHRPNIKRLLSGTEYKIGQKAKKL